MRLLTHFKGFLVIYLTIFSLFLWCNGYCKNNPPLTSKKYDLVICAVFQNEELFLKEWLEFHKLVGVQHFYLYNNLSTDRCLEILHPYIEVGEVDLFNFPVEVNNQMEYLSLLQIPAYQHALNIVKQTARWAAFIDIDEFLFPVKHYDLVSLLKEYEKYPGLVVNWQIYGTGGYCSLPPEKLLIECLTLKAPVETEGNHLVKSIVQPHMVKNISDPHSFIFHNGRFAINSRGERMVEGGRHPSIIIDKIRINHYWFGTRDWFIANKLPRRAKWGLEYLPGQIDSIIAECNQIKDTLILRFVPQLRKKMHLKPKKQAYY